MARTGVYKWDVKDARERLVREGRKPSVDAVREALGNTGSKSTIHKYLKELEAEEGDSGVAVSEALQGLVRQLAERLTHEAEEELASATERFDTDRASLRQELEKAKAESHRLREQLERVEAGLAAEKLAHTKTRTQLTAEETRNVQLGEQVKGLEKRAEELKSHCESLEEKHAHARQALEHFRTAAKEQHGTEQRRHEEQVAQLQAEARSLNSALSEKLASITQITGEAKALAAENGNLRAQLSELKSSVEARTREQAKAEKQNHSLEAELQRLRSSEVDMSAELAQAREQVKVAERASMRLELEREQLIQRMELAESRYVWLSKLADADGIVEPSLAIEQLPAARSKRFQALKKEARRVLGTDAAAMLWMFKRNFCLGDTTPFLLTETEEGTDQARNELGAVEHGLPA